MASSNQNPLPNISEKTHITLETLQTPENRLLFFKLHVFIYELRQFRQDEEMRDRLDRVVDEFYIGMPYFTETEAIQLKSTLVHTSDRNPHHKGAANKKSPEDDKELGVLIQETLNKRYEQTNEKRKRDGDFKVCAAHDLAPIFEKAFGIKPNLLARDKQFLELRKRSNLELNDLDGWVGVPKKMFVKRGKR